VSVRLVGLEQFSDNNSALKEVQSEIETKALVAQVQSRTPGDVALVLHDTSKAEDVNLNELLLTRLDPAASSPPLSPLPPMSPPPPPMSTSPLPISEGATLSSLANAMGMDNLLPPDLASLKSLVPPHVPTTGEFFDVNITLAANPSNFTVSLTWL
jgi:hypothetical protein